MTFAGKTALITGAAKRLGRACALRLAQKGCNIIIHYRSSPREAETLSQEIRKTGRSSWTLRSDLSDTQQRGSLMETAMSLAGKLDFLLNSASMFPSDSFDNASEESIINNIRVNAIAPFLLARDFFSMAQSGAVINFLDTMVLDYDHRHLSYHISKLSFNDMTRILAVEGAPSFRVNAVAPGLVMPPEGKTEAFLEKNKKSNPLCTYGNPDQVVDTVVFLLENEFITGQTVFIDGGRHLHGRLYGT